MEDLAIKNGIIVTPQGEIRGGLTISGGRISHLGNNESLPEARQEMDAQGFVVLPGLIDPHVHLGQDKEEKFKDQCWSESITAALGGITTMITSARFGDPLKPRLKDYQRAKEVGRANSFIDFKFNAFIFNQKHLDELDSLIEEGINSFKLFMHFTPETARGTGFQAIDWGFAYRLFERVAELGPPALTLIHCEEPTITQMLGQRLKSKGRQNIDAWTESRPSITEAMHVYDAGLIAQELGTPLYIVHVSAKESVDAVQHLKTKGVAIFGETCPHYLVLDRHPECGISGKVIPPFRDMPDQKRIWQGLRDGTLDTVGSDHLPYLRQEKETGDLWSTKVGFGSMGATLPLLISEGVNKRKLNWGQLAKITSENTAKIFHIYPQKGAITPGADADLVIVDPHREWVLGAKTLHSRSNFSIYEGWKVKGCVSKTLVRGQLITEDQRLVSETPTGEYVLPSW